MVAKGVPLDPITKAGKPSYLIFDLAACFYVYYLPLFVTISDVYVYTSSTIWVLEYEGS